MNVLNKLKNFKNSLRAKIIIAFSVMIFAIILSNGYNILSLYKINTDIETTLDKELSLLIADEKIAVNMAERTNLLQSYLLSSDNLYREEFEKGIETSIELENQILELTDSQQVKDLINKKIEWGMLSDEIFAEWDKGNEEKALHIFTEEVQPLQNDLMTGFKDMSSKREVKINELGQDVLSNTDSIILFSNITTISVLIIGIVIAIVSSNLIVRPLKIVMARMNQIGNGDLTGEPIEIRNSDEIGQLANSMNDLHKDLKEMIVDVVQVSETVASQSEELTQSASEVSVGAEQIAYTMQELAAGSEQLAMNSSQLASDTSLFTQKVEEADLIGKEIEISSLDVLNLAKGGGELMGASSEQMNKINYVVQDVVGKVETLDNKAKEINKFVSVIQNVADQTKLLSLNAQIEAARAGDAGRGFAVVADEVNKLAGQTAISLKEITQIVEDIQSQFNVVATSLNNGSEEVQKGTIQIEETNQTFNQINNAVEMMVEGIQYISSNLTEVSTKGATMNQAVQEMAAISQESSAGIEETSASGQQTSSSMEEVTASAEQLANLAEKLNLSISKFKL